MTQGVIGRTLKVERSYENAVATVCAKLNLAQPQSFYHGEQAISTHCFKEMWKKLSPSQQEEFNANLQAQSANLQQMDPSLAPAMISAGAIIAGRMSGFGVYMAASTVVGAMTHAVGVTLPFFFYTTMSRGICLFLGPVGWLATGAMVIGALFGPDYTKAAQGILLIAAIRAEKEMDWKSKVRIMKVEEDRATQAVDECLHRLYSAKMLLFSYRAAVPVIILLLRLICFACYSFKFYQR